MTASMRIALKDLKLDHLDHLLVIYPGERRYALGEQVEVMPLAELVGVGSDIGQSPKKGRRR